MSSEVRGQWSYSTQLRTCQFSSIIHLIMLLSKPVEIIKKKPNLYTLQVPRETAIEPSQRGVQRKTGGLPRKNNFRLSAGARRSCLISRGLLVQLHW